MRKRDIKIDTEIECMVFKRPQNNRGYIIVTHIKLVETAVSPGGSSVHCLAVCQSVVAWLCV